MSPLEMHILPCLGRIALADIDQIDILDTLRPIWKPKPDTAMKAIGWLHLCIRHTAEMGLFVDLHATEKEKLLPGQQNKKVKNITLLRWQDTPAF